MAAIDEGRERAAMDRGVGIGLGQLALRNGRADLYASLRVLGLLFNVISPVGWAQDRPLIVVITLLCVIIDLAIASTMRRTGKGFEVARLPYDLALVGFAAAVVPPSWPYSGVLLLMVPMALELVVAGGLPVAASYIVAADLSMYISRVLVGGRTFVFELVFYGFWMLVAAGLVFSLLEWNGYGLRRSFIEEREAFNEMVALDSWNKLLIGAGGAAVEALNRSWHLLTVFLGEDARKEERRFREVQETLAWRSRSSAVYLRDLLLKTAAEQRATRAAVAEHLHLDVAREHGLTVLTASQAVAFSHQVRKLSLVGKHSVAVKRVDRVTGEVDVQISQWTVRIPPSPTPAVRLVILATVFGNLALVALANPIYAAVPVPSLLFAFLVSLTVGILADTLWRWGVRWGSWLLLLSSLTPAVVSFALTQLEEVRWRLADGRLIAPAMIGLTSSLYIAGAVVRFLSPLSRVVMGIAYALVAFLIFTSNPYGTPSGRSVLGELVIPASVMLAVYRFERQNRELGSAVQGEMVQLFRARESELRKRCFSEYAELLAAELLRVETFNSESAVPENGQQRIAADLGEARTCLKGLGVLPSVRA